jgi:hypothetical protein
MARRADDERDSELEHELRVARYLAWAFVAQSHGIGMDYARKKYADVPAGAFWVDIFNLCQSWFGLFLARPANVLGGGIKWQA